MNDSTLIPRDTSWKNCATNPHTDSTGIKLGEVDAYQQLDIIEKAKYTDNLSYYRICSRTIDLLGNYVHGIKISSLSQRYYNTYNESWRFCLYSTTQFGFFQDYLSNQVKMIRRQGLNGFTLSDANDEPSDRSVVILSVYFHLLMYGPNDGTQLKMKILGGIQKQTILFLRRIKVIINAHRGGLFLNEISKIYEDIYRQAYDVDQYNLNIEFLVSHIVEVSIRKSLIHTREKYVYTKHYLVHDEIEENISRYFFRHTKSHAQQLTGSVKGGRTAGIKSLMQYLAKRGNHVIPVRELCPLYQKYWKHPLVLEKNDEYTVLSNMADVGITENYFISGKIATVFWLNTVAGATRFRTPFVRFECASDLESDFGDLPIVRINEIGNSDNIIYISNSKRYNQFKHMSDMIKLHFEMNPKVGMIEKSMLLPGMPTAVKVRHFYVTT